MDKSKPQFNILSNKSTTHEEYHTGTLNLSNLSSLLVDGDSVKLDLGLIHAKSKIERGIKFTSDESEVKDGKKYWVVWVALDRNENGPYYAGLTACPMVIDKENRKGYKNLAFHVNRMDDALKRRVKVDGMVNEEKVALANFLKSYKEGLWENSKDDLKDSLG